MGVWSRVALVAASAAAGALINRFAGTPEARQQLMASARRAGTDLELRRPASGASLERFRGLSGRVQEFTARLKEGMDEREAELKQQFGVRAATDHTANHPASLRQRSENAHTIAGNEPRPSHSPVQIVPSSEGNLR